MLDGWDRSHGVKREVDFAKAVDMPIEYMEVS
jgi:hypothetical protein